MTARDDYPLIKRFAADHVRVLPTIGAQREVRQMLDELDRLRLENQQFRDQFKEADEIIAEWNGRTSPPPGWEKLT